MFGELILTTAKRVGCLYTQKYREYVLANAKRIWRFVGGRIVHFDYRKVCKRLLEVWRANFYYLKRIGGLALSQNRLSDLLQAPNTLWSNQYIIYELLKPFYMLCCGQNKLFELLQASYTLLRQSKRTLRPSTGIQEACRGSESVLATTKCAEGLHSFGEPVFANSNHI